MQLRIAALADYTNITQNGKLNILGIFSQIHAQSVPAVHPQMQFVMQFAFEPDETGERVIRVVLQDEDGVQVLSVDGRVNIPPTMSPDPVVFNQVLAFQNVILPHFGSYEFVIEVDGNPVSAQIPLDVLPMTAPAES